jgi:predicted ester cyclase
MSSRLSILAVVVAGVILVGSIIPKALAGDVVATPEKVSNVDVCRKFMEEVFNKGNLMYVEEHIASSFHDHDPFPGQSSDLSGLMKGVAEFRAAFPDGVATVKEAFGAGEMVTLISTFSGTNTGPLWGTPATGKAVSEVEIVDVLRFENGKCVEHWGQMDVMKMMTQLGQIPQ